MVNSCQMNPTTSTTITSTSNSMALTGLPHLVWLAMASHRESHGWRGLKVSAKPCHANKLTAPGFPVLGSVPDTRRLNVTGQGSSRVVRDLETRTDICNVTWPRILAAYFRQCGVVMRSI
jgi:hypothetical protein